MLFYPWLTKNALLARILQDSCKQRFFLEDLVRKLFPCKLLQVVARCLAEKCINLEDLGRKAYKILVSNAFFSNQGCFRETLCIVFPFFSKDNSGSNGNSLGRTEFASKRDEKSKTLTTIPIAYFIDLI